MASEDWGLGFKPDVDGKELLSSSDVYQYLYKQYAVAPPAAPAANRPKSRFLFLTRREREREL